MTGHELRGAVAGDEALIAHHGRRDLRPQQREHDVSAAEDERARAVERIGKREAAIR